MAETINQENNTNSNKKMFDLMEQMGVSNPRLRMLAEFMNQQNGLQGERSIPEKNSLKKERALAKYKRALEENVYLRNENEILAERTNMLTSALGACHCLGEEEECEDCQGKGKPGSFLPDNDAFVEYIRPVIVALQKHKRHRVQIKDVKCQNIKNENKEEGGKNIF